MTYLELCKHVAQECGIGDADGSEPASVKNQVGELKRVVDWVRQAWKEIQVRHDGNWRWMRSKFDLTTSAGQSEYAPSDCQDTRLSASLDRFSKWLFSDHDNPPRVYRQSDGVSGEQWLIRISWADYRTIFDLGQSEQGQPVYITVDPQDNIVLAPKPDDVYVVTGEYKMAPQILAENSDKPDMPEQFHYLIVYDAMRKYAGFEAANEVMTRAIQEGRPLLRALENNQLPRWRAGRPLV